MLLEQLAERRARVAAGDKLELQRVTVFLRSGRELTGTVVKVGTAPGRSTEKILLLQLPGPNARGPHEDVAFLPLGSLEGAVLHRAAELAPKPSAPTRLEISRRVAALEAKLTQLVGRAVACQVNPMPEAEGERGTVAALVEVVEQVLLEVGADALGLEALRAKVQTVTLAARPAAAADEAPPVALAAPELRLWASTERVLSKAELKAAVEAVL